MSREANYMPSRQEQTLHRHVKVFSLILGLFVAIIWYFADKYGWRRSHTYGNLIDMYWPRYPVVTAVLASLVVIIFIGGTYLIGHIHNRKRWSQIRYQKCGFVGVPSHLVGDNTQLSGGWKELWLLHLNDSIGERFACPKCGGEECERIYKSDIINK